METLVANISGRPRRELLNGREHIVVPMSLIVNGVLSGSQGSLFYPVEEISKDVNQWNGMPLVKDHPYANGRSISARSLAVLNSQGLGVVLNARYVKNTKKLKAEGWFDIEKTREVDSRILDSLLQGKPIELSTGLFTDNIPATGSAVHNGVPYTHVATNYKPDHVAILPDKKGACSINDGCGVLVNEGTTMADIELTYNRNWSQSKRNKAPSQDFAGPDESFPIADQADVDAASHLVGKASDPAAVKAKIIRIAKRKGLSIPPSWKKPTENDDDEGDDDTGDMSTNNERTIMKLKPQKREEIITKLITNCACEGGHSEFSEEDRAVLNELSDDALQAILTKQEVTANAGTTKVTVGKKKASPAMEEEEETEDGQADNKNAQGNLTPTKNERKPVEVVKPLTANEWMEQAPVEIRAAVQNAMRIETREKQLIVNRLVAHMPDGDPKVAAITKLMTKPIDDLMERETLMPKPAVTNDQAAPALPLYFTSGVAAPVTNRLGDTNKQYESDFAPLPVMNWDEMASPAFAKRRSN